eukprot:CAMPEP_0203653044 /NCGR_PEP_ID=MMETSP0088-20131115/31577_1 /ASSEMBLY_ACC=CAM_ASM_001087 /TAXON_ID=426623 /ORGANISM="Chaetoceros affinis, Strain CCMP159" /LENGTH=40 /DNA_ID= /DNA_START= /DNA_END= /DNA_ORIENTATION=
MNLFILTLESNVCSKDSPPSARDHHNPPSGRKDLTLAEDG